MGRFVMFNFFKNKKIELTNVDDEGKIYDADDIVVHYEGTLISPEYAAETLVFQNNGKKLRDDFNTQPYPYHALYPHGKGKMTYKDGEDKRKCPRLGRKRYGQGPTIGWRSHICH